MPTYIYTNEETGKSIERWFSMKDVPSRVVVDDVVYEHDIGAEHRGFMDTPGNWNKFTMGIDGVGPSQAKELSDYLAEQGVPTEVNAEGCIKYTSRAHRAAVHRARGMLDRDGGYSDCTVGERG